MMSIYFCEGKRDNINALKCESLPRCSAFIEQLSHNNQRLGTQKYRPVEQKLQPCMPQRIVKSTHRV